MPSYVVTGASPNRGIGLEFIRQLSASSENEVFALVRNKTAALAIPESTLKSGLNNIHIIEADVTDIKSLKSAASKVAEITGGSLDFLINNAAAINGENDWRSLLDLCSEGEEEQLTKEWDYALTSWELSTLPTVSLPLLRQGPTKKVITISSSGGDRDFVSHTNLAAMAGYGVTKAAVNMVVTKYAIPLRSRVPKFGVPGHLSAGNPALPIP
ncbi:NAD(P)-binding protein [Ramaria rubella]|nr:NAD(P)-binding protein [Ramaria rubella]